VAREAIFYTIYIEPGISPQGFGILRLNLIVNNRGRFHQHLTQLLDRADPKNEKKKTLMTFCVSGICSRKKLHENMLVKFTPGVNFINV
jgi:hypothetical protein